MLVGPGYHFVRQERSRRDARKIFEDSPLLSAFYNQESNRFRKKCDQEHCNDYWNCSADQEYGLPAVVAYQSRNCPTRKCGSERKTAEHHHDCCIAGSLRHV